MASKGSITLVSGLLNTFKEDKHTISNIKQIQSEDVQHYKWDWKQKLNASPFRKQLQRLKQENKTNPSSKSANNAYKRSLKAKERKLLSEFQQKCEQAKIWINEAHKQYNDQHNANVDDIQILKQISIQRKIEKIDAIDKFWDELTCHQTVYIQNEKIKQQNEQMAALEKQLEEQKEELAQIYRNKKGVPSQEFVQSQKDKFTNNETQNVVKKKKRKSKQRTDEYKGLIGYYNRAPKNTKKKKKKEKQKTEEATNDEPTMGFASYSVFPKLDENEEKQSKETVKEEIKKEKEKEIKKKKKGKKGSIKGGFLKAGTNGLYDDKKLDSELTIDEKNAKNRKQIEDMGFADAVDNPQYRWERPKKETVANNDKDSSTNQ